MSDLLGILAHDILPIFIVIGLGFVFGKRLQPDPRALSRVAFYVLSPCLVFVSLLHSDLAGGEMFQITVFTIGVALTMGGLGWLAARLLRLDARDTAGLLLVCMFVNGGNYGLGVNQRAFGDEGLARAVIYFITSTLLVYTLGVSIASVGGDSGLGWRGAVRRMFQVPQVYAALAALLLRALAVDVMHPALEPALAGIEIAGRAAIPILLILLGVQLAQTPVTAYVRPALAASGLRLIVGPAVAWVAAGAIGLSGVARQASIVEASMPAAVINIILATEYQAAPALVTGAVIVSTLLSPFTLALIISLLK